jgi:hypothetical protein
LWRYYQLNVHHRCQMEKIFNQKSFNYFFWHLLAGELTAVVVDTGGIFDTGVVDTNGNFPPASLTLAANLPPVSLPPVSTTPAYWWQNLPPVSMIYLTCEYLANFRKISKWP